MLPTNELLSSISTDTEENYNVEIEEIVKNTLQDRASASDMQEFIKYINSILNKETKNLIENYQNSNTNENVPNKNYSSKSQPYSINLYIMQPPQVQPSIPPTPVNQCPQQFSNPIPIQNYSPNPNQIFPPIQFTQPALPLSHPPIKHEHKSQRKSKDSKKKDISKKKSKKPTKHKETKQSKTSKETKESTKIKEFLFQSGNQFKGIFNYLSTLKPGNISTNGTIKISANTVNQFSFSKCDPELAVDFDSSQTGYKSSNEEISWICFDFKERKVQLFSYQILSNNDRDFGQLKNWVIETSNDQNEWKIIDRHNDDSTLRRSSFIATFSIGNPGENGFYRFIRLRQTGNSWHLGGSGYLFNIPKIEFYGKIKDN